MILHEPMEKNNSTACFTVLHGGGRTSNERSASFSCVGWCQKNSEQLMLLMSSWLNATQH